MTFLEKYELLKKSVPVPAVIIKSSTDCEYVDGIYNSKDCYYSYRMVGSRDCIYTRGGLGSKLVDCRFVVESEKCYQSLDCNKCYNSTYLLDCNGSIDCHFSTFLNSCSNCFGCIGLTRKKYCIFNKQYSKEEYYKKLQQSKKEKPEKILEQMFELNKQIPHPANQQFNTENCLYGDYIYNSKSCYWCFSTYYSENSGYNYIAPTVRNCWDTYYSGGYIDKKTFSERCYELVDVRNCYECAFLISSQDCSNCYYSSYLANCSESIGCVGLVNKKYCILNNQLSKEQYAKAVREIKIELGWKFST